MDFKEKVVLITGASRGIGKETAIKFAREGAKVVVNYHYNEKAAEETLKSLEGEGHFMLAADISRPEQAKKLVDITIETFGRIDILVNNAGIFLEQPIKSTSYDQWILSWNQTLGINLLGPAYLSYLVSKPMIDQQYGKIINISSRGAFRGEPDNLAYGASKGGLNSFSQSLAKALGGDNIAVFAIAPGFVETDMGKASLEGPLGEFIRNESPLKRVATPEEVANTILFLASDNATFLTGGIIDINGASFLRM